MREVATRYLPADQAARRIRDSGRWGTNKHGSPSLRLDTVTAVLARDYSGFAGIRALLIRPDGYIAWATAADDPPPLARWLGGAR